MKTTISSFKSTASLPERGIVVIFDLEGFSHFFSQPDVQEYVPKFLNIILDAISTCYEGGEFYWLEPVEKLDKLPPPIHSKFLGDGGLFIWRDKDLTETQLIDLVNRLFNLRLYYDNILKKASDVVPVIDIPKTIRFGIAAGTMYKLTYKLSNKEEFIGYSINLASRLQSYCDQVGFIVSGRLNIPSSRLDKHGYKKVIATKIKGLAEEIVIVDKESFEGLSDDIKKQLFKEI